MPTLSGRSRPGFRKLTPVPLEDVSIAGGFWGPRVEANRRVTIPHVYRMLEESGRVDALKMTWRPGDQPEPHVFWESDVAKWLEAACHSLAARPDAKLRRRVDRVVALLAGAQQADGYLNVHFTLVEPDQRWANLRDRHELYCAGHLMEAAVAHFRATGQRTLLDVMCRYADYIDSVFGRAKGKRRGYPGHEEIELALIKLYRITGQRRYLRLAEYFVDERGRRPHYFDREAKARGERVPSRSYDCNQSHLPVRQQRQAAGHAVRAMYLYAGMADLAAETNDAGLRTACRRLWRNVTERRMYLTGGVGARHHGEAFGGDYELPNAAAYAETCAAIGLIFWAHRMLHLEADGRYADVMERALYNGFLSGISLDGTGFFYVNPLESDGLDLDPRHTCRRQRWFSCACCPTNVARLLASLGGYIYSTGPRALYVHLYVSGQGRAVVAGQGVLVRQDTPYPWSGAVRLTVTPERPGRFTLCLRRPAWCERWAVRVNGTPAPCSLSRGYIRLRRTWHPGDTVDLKLDMPPRLVQPHPAVASAAGRVALNRGPLVYCLEQPDHSADVRTLTVPLTAALRPKHQARLLGGVTTIEATGLAPSSRRAPLYAPAVQEPTTRVPIKGIPYYAWANRGPGRMAVWLRRG